MDMHISVVGISSQADPRAPGPQVEGRPRLLSDEPGSSSQAAGSPRNRFLLIHSSEFLLHTLKERRQKRARASTLGRHRPRLRRMPRIIVLFTVGRAGDAEMNTREAPSIHPPSYTRLPRIAAGVLRRREQDGVESEHRQLDVPAKPVGLKPDLSYSPEYSFDRARAPNRRVRALDEASPEWLSASDQFEQRFGRVSSISIP
jgi:hypothetical protein